MYLSRVEIDVNDRQKMRDLTHLGAYHGWVEQSFPKEIAERKRLRHLWRIDILKGHSYLLLLSPDRPDLQKLGRYSILGTAQTVNYDKFLDSIQEGQLRPFRLTANAVHRKTGTQAIKPISTVPELEEWLLARANDHGFSIAVASSNGQKELRVSDHHSEPLRRGGRRAKLSMTSYEGILRVTNATKLKQVLIHGIGREKAYGCGLLTVMPAIEK